MTERGEQTPLTPRNADGSQTGMDTGYALKTRQGTEPDGTGTSGNVENPPATLADRYGGDAETTEPRVVARYTWDVDHEDQICIDRATGKEVVRYDLGDPANYAPSYGGWSKREWLERKGLDPDATVDVASAATPIPEWEVEFYRRQMAREAEVDRLEAEARDLLDFIGDDANAFDFSKYREGEQDILRPALERRGFTSVRFYMGEEDSFGPLSRMCAAKDPNGAEVRFYYG